MKIIILFKKIKHFLIRTIININSKFYILPKEPTVVVCMDGGLCSQMFDYIIGEYFKNNGYNVFFDLNWFEEDGLDVLRKNKRYFEINQIYPDLIIKKASKNLINAYKLRCRTNESDLKKIISTQKNYYIVNDHPLFIEPRERNIIFHNIYNNPKIVQSTYINDWQEKINNSKESCAIHIRRGDLAIESVAIKSGYGHVCKDSYIFSAMNIMSQLKPGIEFFIFSDEIEYVKKSIVPQGIKNNQKIHIVTDENLANKEGGGINDFYLISKCKHNIATLGSFGYVAAQINNNTDKILITLPKEVEDFSNYVILDTEGKLIDTSIQKVKSMIY